MRVQCKFILLLLILVSGCKSSKDCGVYDEDENVVYPASMLPHSPRDYPAAKTIGVIHNCTCRETPLVYVVCFGKCQKCPMLKLEKTIPLFQLKLSDMETLHRGDLQFMIHLDAMELESNTKLAKIETGAFFNLNKLRNLTISESPNLRMLQADVFNGLVMLRTLILTRNGFSRIEDAAQSLSLVFVPALRLLDLSNNIFPEISKTAFYTMNGTNLTDLSLYLCEVEYIHPECLQPFRNNLTNLRLGQNLLNETTISNLVEQIYKMNIPLDLLNLYAMGMRSLLPYEILTEVAKTNITLLILAGNHFDYIPETYIPLMLRLQSLDLRSCSISTIAPYAFKNIKYLITLLLGDNNLYTIPQAVLVESLQELYLEGNQWVEEESFYIPERIFENLTNLTNLQMSYNNIGSILEYTFYGMTKLRILNLKYTSLSFIAFGAFRHLKKLAHLNLNNNPLLVISPITADTFLGLHELRVLLLAGCGITNLTSNSLFSNVRNLTYLGLSNNNLMSITSNQLMFLNQLRRINLRDNQLIPWNNHVLPQNNYNCVDLSQNRFTYLTPTMMEELQKSQISIMYDNPFYCDCSLFPVTKWLQCNSTFLNIISSKDFVANCIAPISWRNKPISKYIHELIDSPKNCEVSNFDIISLIMIAIFFFVCLLPMYIFRWYIRYWLFLMRISYAKHNFWKIKKSPKTDDFPDYKYDAFISYSSEDNQFVDQLIVEIESKEPFLKLCFYERDFQIGTSISQAILHSVTNSKRTILVVSNAFAKSQWCRWETQLAEFNNLYFRRDEIDNPDDTLLMIKLEKLEKKFITPTLKYLLKTRIYLEWSDDAEKREEFWNKIRNTLSNPKQ